jgi:hypothetical protein
MTLAEIEDKLAKGLIQGYVINGEKVTKQTKANKYKNQEIEIDGIKFKSKKESRRYVELRMLQKAGEITDLRLQVPYELNEGGAFSYKYLADFVYIRGGKEVVEDAKGYRTKEYKKKKRLMKKVHNIEIKEV